MKKIKGRWRGSCFECGHGISVTMEDNTQMIHCVPKKTLMDEYDKGCDYLIPHCEHVDTTEEELHKEG